MLIRSSLFAEPDAEQGDCSIQQNTRLNRGSSKNTNQSTKSSSKTEDSHAGANTNNNEQVRKSVTVTAGDWIFQNIRGWSISKSNKVVVNSFPGVSTEDMEDFVKIILLNSLSCDNLSVRRAKLS